MSSTPKLTEPGITHFINNSLLKCHQLKMVYYNKLVNAGFLLLFFVILGSILIYKYKGKLTPSQIKQKNLEKYKYILEKVRKTTEEKQKQSQQLITGLPNWNNDFDNI